MERDDAEYAEMAADYATNPPTADEVISVERPAFVSAEGPYTDKQLMESARDYAFNGLLNITVLREHAELKATLRDHFTAILEHFDAIIKAVDAADD